MTQFHLDESKKKTVLSQKNREMTMVNAEQIGVKHSIQLNDKLRRQKELKEAQDKAREFEIKTQLDEMRQRRIQAEVSLN